MTITKKEIFGHPVGLYVLFFTEMWERFSYYGMRAIFTLYLVSKTTDVNYGLGWDKSEALALYGWYTMLVYVAGILGGWLADKVLGQKKAVIFGAVLLVIGHTLLIFSPLWVFYTGLGFIILGVGFLKPNISTMVGGLYKEGDMRRDKGFTIFYIGINIGALLAGIVVGYVGEKIGWHYGFGLAGFLMVLGLLQFLAGQKYLKGVGDLLSKSNNENLRKTAHQKLTKIEKDRIIVLLISFLMIIVFFGAFEQAGGLMNLYAREKIDRIIFGWEVPASWFQSVNSFFIIVFGTLVAGFWVKRKLKNKLSDSLFKMIIGLILVGIGFIFMTFAALDIEIVSGSIYQKSAMYWLILAYLFHTLGELCLSPVALSFVTKLAPVKYASLMMGIYFATTGFGNKIAGILGEFATHGGNTLNAYEQNDQEMKIFTFIAVFCIAFGFLVYLFYKKLYKLTHAAEE